jgi:predicted RNA binding protein YcfA (HicA-like mRNA interferase family)
MKLPRDVSGRDLVSALRKLRYEKTRQRGAHIRVTTQQGGQHHETVPDHHRIKAGTLSGILRSIAAHHRLSVDELLNILDL